jgi:hypothetical protein
MLAPRLPYRMLRTFLILDLLQVLDQMFFVAKEELIYFWYISWVM